MIMFRKFIYALLIGGLSLAPLGAFAKHPYPAERKFGDTGVQATNPYGDSAVPDQSDAVDYGIRVSESESDSPFPDQTNSGDYGIRISGGDSDSPFPDQTNSDC